MKDDNNQRALARWLAKERQTMIHVVVAVSVLTVSGVLIRRESRILKGYESKATPGNTTYAKTTSSQTTPIGPGLSQR